MDTIADRYGRGTDARRRRLLVAGFLVLLAVGVAWSLWYALTRGNPDVSWEDVGYRTTPGAVDVTFDVTFAGSVHAGASAVCTVQAQNEVHSEIGLKDVQVHRGSSKTVRVTATVPTSEPAATGLVKDCALS